MINQTQTLFLDLEKNWLSMKPQNEFYQNENSFSKTEFKVSDSIIFSISFSEANGLIVKKNIIELDRHSGFVKHEFLNNNETIYGTRYCKIVKNIVKF